MGGLQRLVPSLAVRFSAVALLMLAAVAGVLAIVGQARVEVPGQLYPGRQSVIIAEEARESWWDLPRLQDRLARLRADLEAEVTIRDAGGAVVATNVDPPLPPLSEGLQGRLAHPGDRVARSQSKDRLEIVARVERPPEPPRFVIMALRMPGLRFGRVLPAAALAVALIGLASLYLAWSVLRPLQRLAAAARELGEGRLDARVRMDRRDEIGEVARTFDAMADRLARLVRGQQEMLLDISHELRTPLARIRVALDLLQDREARPDPAELEGIQQDLDELDQVLGGILQEARNSLAVEGMGQGPLRLRREVFGLDGITAEAIARFRLRHPGWEVERSGAFTGEARVAGDPMLIRRAVENLLDNAARHSGAAHRLHLLLDRDSARLRLAVKDEGRGIAAEELGRVGTPFFRGAAEAGGAEGLGLGLGLVRRIAAAHGGAFELRSEPGHGTEAILWLPAAEAPPTHADTGPPSA